MEWLQRLAPKGEAGGKWFDIGGILAVQEGGGVQGGVGGLFGHVNISKRLRSWGPGPYRLGWGAEGKSATREDIVIRIR